MPAEPELVQPSATDFYTQAQFRRELALTGWRRSNVEPFLGTEAIAAGMASRHQLATHYNAIYRNVYLPKGRQLTAAEKAKAAWLWSGRRATVAGISAAALHGSLWIDTRLPAELNQRSQHRTDGIVLRDDTLAADETLVRQGISLTTPARTAFDLGRHYGRTLAVIRLDSLMRATGLRRDAVLELAGRYPGARGIRGLRNAIGLADAGAESPQETRTRLVLTDAGLPPKRTQINVYNRYGAHVGRIDMGWDDWLVGVEYDGIQHWADPAVRNRDIDRQAELEALGWRIVRVSADMLRYRPHTIVERTRAALRAAGRRT